MLKLSGLFDNNRLMHEGSFRFLKQVGCFIRLCELKSLSRITLLHFHESESIGKAIHMWFNRSMFWVERTTQKPFFLAKV